MRTLDLIVPQLGQLTVLAALTVVVLLLMGLGRLLSGRLGPATALIAGWGASVFVFVLVGTLTPLRFHFIAGGLAVPSSIGLGLLVRDRFWDDPAWRRAGRVLVLSLPLILVVAGMRVSQWDELAQWLPNTQFLIAYDRFPSAALPNPGSILPAYPYALPLVGYVTSLLPGGLSDRAGLLFNLLLLLAAAWTIADIIAARRADAMPLRAESSTLAEWGLAAGALIAAIPLNPSFVPKLVFSNYSDNATSCTLAITAVIGTRWLKAMVMQRPERHGLAVACACGATALVSLRQANLALFLLLALGFALAALPEARSLGRRALSGLLMLPLPLLTSFLWQRYGTAELQTGAVRMLPFAEWHFDQLGDTLGSMLQVAVGKGGLFGLMTALAILAAATLLRPALLDATARMLCRITAFVFIGYLGFLLFAYISTFNDYEGLHAASFWRYSTHLGMIGVVSTVAAVAPYWRLRPVLRRGLAAIAVVVVLVLPAAAAKRLRFDIVHPHDGYLLAVARDMGAMLPAGSRIELVDLHHDGSNLLLVRYKLLFARRPDGRLPELSVTAQTGISQAMKEPEKDFYVWLDEGGPEMRELFGIDLPAGASYLLLRGRAGYRLVRAWPATAESEIFTAADFD
jgi:hypothetical protein